MWFRIKINGEFECESTDRKSAHEETIENLVNNKGLLKAISKAIPLCDKCGDKSEVLTKVYGVGEHEYWCQACVLEKSFVCEECDKRFHHTNVAEFGGLVLCRSCERKLRKELSI